MAAGRQWKAPEIKPLNCRRVEDFPDFVAAVAKFEDLQTRQAAKEAEWRQLDKLPNDYRLSQIDVMARELVDGEVAVLDAPDKATVKRECEAFRKAIELQHAEVERQRRLMASEIAKDLAKDHRALIADAIAKQKAANEAYNALLEMKSAAIRHCGGADCLPPFEVSREKRLWFNTHFAEFERVTKSYVETGVVSYE